MTKSSAGRLRGDACGVDWIWDRGAETLSAEDYLTLSGDAWDRQFARIKEQSPFYAHKFRDAGIGQSRVRLADIAELPFTTKAEQREAIEEDPPFGTNVCVPHKHVKRIYQTSGTTGEPSVLALTTNDMESWTAIGTRTYFATGIHAHHSVLTTFGAGPFVAGHTHFVLGRIGTRMVPVAPGDTERVLFGLRARLVDTLLATPSFAQYLANRLENSPHTDPRAFGLTHIVTGGEPGGGIPAIRDHIERTLGVTVTEVMGIGDVAPSLYGECPLQQGMHFCGTGHVWPELIDPDTREPMSIETGAVGELVYTALTRESMPVVRFLSGDLARVEGTSCECGRTSFRMRCIGRRDDMFIVRGVNVYPSAILAVVGEFRPRVTGRARVVLRAAGVSVDPPVPIEVEVTAEHAADPALATAIEAAVHTKLMFRSKVALVTDAAFGDAGYKTNLSVKRP